MFPQIPTTIKEYNFIKEIGKGGFSQVYLIESIKYHTNFVAKVILVEDQFKSKHWETFDAEIRSLQRLDHPHIIRLYDHFAIDNLFYIILEYCSNGSVQDEIEKNGGLTSERFITLSKQIVDALLYCQDMNVSHHDIKPHNILIDQFGRAKLADFGLSLNLRTGDLSSSFAGSLMYTAPEIFSKKAYNPFKADIWSLGVTFATMITGDVPWPASTYERLRQLVKSGHYVLKTRPPSQIGELIRNMIVVDPQRRISLKEIRLLKIFIEQNNSSNLSKTLENVADPLSPRGRLLSPKNNSHSVNFRPISPLSFDETEDKTKSKALLLGSTTIIGSNKPSKIKKRLHVIKKNPSFGN